jgi:hypothetical protein
MKFEIPFNAENEYQEKLFLWKYIWTKGVRSTWLYLIMMIALFLFSLLVYKNNISSTVMIALSFGLILAYILSLRSIERHKRRYMKNVVSRGKTLEGAMLIYEFNEEHFMYSDTYLSYSLKWMEFEKFASSPNILMMKLKHQQSFSYVISKHTFGEEAYSKIIEFLKTKLPQESF